MSVWEEEVEMRRLVYTHGIEFLFDEM
jgi:hypothetical protein